MVKSTSSTEATAGIMNTTQCSCDCKYQIRRIHRLLGLLGLLGFLDLYALNPKHQHLHLSSRKLNRAITVVGNFTYGNLIAFIHRKTADIHEGKRGNDFYFLLIPFDPY